MTGGNALRSSKSWRTGSDLHFLQIKFAIEKKAEPLGLISGAAQQLDRPGIAHGGIRDGVVFEFDLWLCFCHAP